MKNIHHILVTGANGQLGQEFVLLSRQYPQYQFFFVSREELPIENETAVRTFFKEQAIDCCINCAAYTAVDKAESEKETAMLINSKAVGNLAALCKEYNSLFIHFSTDYVFNGQATVPYKETDTSSPVNFYGQTKLSGETLALENNKDSIIIRTSWVYSSFGKNFVKTMVRLMNEKSSIGVVADQYGCPTYAADLAAAVMRIIEGETHQPGIYHYCNEGVISWYEFASAIREITGSKCQVNPITTEAYPTTACRPQYSALDTHKIQEQFKLEIPAWRESLERCTRLLKAGG